MELKQRLELRKLLAPQMQQSLKILALPLLDVKQLVDEEMLNNPLLEEYQPKEGSQKSETTPQELEKLLDSLSPAPTESEKPIYSKSDIANLETKIDYSQSLLTKKVSLQDVLLRQLGMFANSDEELSIGQEIIGNIDENGYLKATLEEIAVTLKVPAKKVEIVLKLIQQFEPAGVAARTISECLLIQLELANENEPLLQKIVQFHLDDIAKKNFSKICQELKEPLEKIEPLIKKISKLDPKPGRNYSTDEIHQVIPDVIIEDDEGQIKITINNENIPHITINKSYRDMLKKDNLDANTREFLINKLRRAYELLSAISKRQSTLRKVIETLVEIQKEAIIEDFSYLKPLTFKDVAEKIKMHESTVCRVVMNKYAQTPCGIVALKNFFPSRIHDKGENGESISSQHIKGFILDLIEEEDKKHPLSDEDIVKLFKEKNNLNVARRTVAKYREELKILSSPYRRER
jgi:RNA polymerase sigma-54 factor